MDMGQRIRTMHYIFGINESCCTVDVMKRAASLSKVMGQRTRVMNCVPGIIETCRTFQRGLSKSRCDAYESQDA